MQLLVIQYKIKMFHIRLVQILILQSLKSQYYKIFKTLKLSYLQLNRSESFCCYNSRKVTLCGDPIYNLYVDDADVLAQYVLRSLCVEMCDVFRYAQYTY